MASVRSDELVDGGDSTLNTNGHGLLANGEMAETADELGLVQSVGGHLHTAHGGHVAVHANELFLGDLDVERRHVAPVRDERVGMESECEGLGLGLGRGALDRRRVRCCLQPACESLGRRQRIQRYELFTRERSMDFVSFLVVAVSTGD